jgi:hypothetical protein
MTNTSNLYRKVRSLLAKTVSAGCTAPEHVAATNLASTIVKKHSLDAKRLDWPKPPRGYEWAGEPGLSIVVEKPEAKPAQKAKAKRVTQGDRIIEMLRRKEGVTIAQLIAEFGILAHTARALVSVNGRKIGGAKLDRATGIYRAA